MNPRIFTLSLTMLLSTLAMAQTNTSLAGTIVINDGMTQPTEQFLRVLYGTGEAGTRGAAVVALTLTQNRLTSDYSTGQGPFNTSVALMFNSLDQIVINFQAIQDPDFTTVTVGGTVSTTGGRGVYAGATSVAGAFRLTLTRTSTSPLRYTAGMTGTATVGGQEVSLAIVNIPLTLTRTRVNLFDTQPGTCAFPAIGNGTVTQRVRPDSNSWDDKVKFLEISFTCSFSATDSLRGFVVFTVIDAQNDVLEAGPITITGGAGRFAGASGTGQVTDVAETADRTVTVRIAGTVIEAQPTTPIITSVMTPYWRRSPLIAQNDWIEIKGSNLVPANTPAGGVVWSNAPDFAQGRMPTEINGVSVTVNGRPAYVYFFCSKATTPACSEDQINVLTPLDAFEGEVMVVVKNGAVSSGAFQVTKTAVSPSILRFSSRGDVTATHLDGRLLGPTSLFPGLSTPGARGETVSLWTVGFGLPTTPLVQGSATQTGLLPFTPACFLGGDPASVVAALVSPGLYQLNVTIPNSAKAGDNPFYCTTPNEWTEVALIAVR